VHDENQSSDQAKHEQTEIDARADGCHGSVC
jgi:hypothetical protein